MQRTLFLSERWACFVVRLVPAWSYCETKTGYLVGIPRLLFSHPRHLYQLGTSLNSYHTAGCVCVCLCAEVCADCMKSMVMWYGGCLSLRHHTRKCQFYSIDKWKDCITHFQFPLSHPLCTFYRYTLFFCPHRWPFVSPFLHFSSPPFHSKRDRQVDWWQMHIKNKYPHRFIPLPVLLLPLLDANPEVVKMPVPLFLLLVPPLFLQHSPLCFLQQLQAIRWQEHVG